MKSIGWMTADDDGNPVVSYNSNVEIRNQFGGVIRVYRLKSRAERFADKDVRATRVIEVFTNE